MIPSSTSAPDSPPVRVTLELLEPVPQEIDAGVDFSLVVAAAAPSGHILPGTPFKIMDADRDVVAGEWPEPAGERPHAAVITLIAPPQISEFTWTFVLLAHGARDVSYAEARLDFTFRTRPHATSLAVWDHPSAIVAGGLFCVKVGAKCAAGCALAGKEIEIHDARGTVVAAGSLDDTPWPGTTALYWAAVNVTAPTQEGHFSWSLNFSAAELCVPHGGASASFSFVTSSAPEHSVAVNVVEKDTLTPIHDAHVRLGVHRASTGESGVATLAVPAGEHLLSIWKAGYDAPERMVCVTKRETLQIEVTRLPEEDPFAFWKG